MSVLTTPPLKRSTPRWMSIASRSTLLSGFALAALLACSGGDRTAPEPQPNPQPTPTEAVRRLRIVPATVSVEEGQSTQLKVFYDRADATTDSAPSVDWTVATESAGAVVIDSTGKVTAKTAATVTVRATLRNDTLAATATVTVTSAPVTAFDVIPADLSLNVGDTLRLRAVVRDASGAVIKDVHPVWTSQAPSVLTVDSAGLARAVAPSGSVVASVLADVGSVRRTVPFRVLAAPPPAPSTGIQVSVQGPSDLRDVFVTATYGDNTTESGPATTTAAFPLTTAGTQRVFAIAVPAGNTYWVRVAGRGSTAHPDTAGRPILTGQARGVVVTSGNLTAVTVNLDSVRVAAVTMPDKLTSGQATTVDVTVHDPGEFFFTSYANVHINSYFGSPATLQTSASAKLAVAPCGSVDCTFRIQPFYAPTAAGTLTWYPELTAFFYHSLPDDQTFAISYSPPASHTPVQ